MLMQNIYLGHETNLSVGVNSKRKRYHVLLNTIKTFEKVRIFQMSNLFNNELQPFEFRAINWHKGVKIFFPKNFFLMFENFEHFE